jgi:methylmalonyl-CoA/ethylmalonyl-CoA epimerase
VAFAHGGNGPGDALATVLGLVSAHVEEADGFREEMIPVGDGALQLLKATGPGTVATFLERRGPGLHHVALRVDDVAAITADLCARGIDMVDPVPRAGGAGTRIAFAHPRAFGGMLVEFVEDRP